MAFSFLLMGGECRGLAVFRAMVGLDECKTTRYTRTGHSFYHIESMQMLDNILSYFDMCQREGTSLQKGMNFRLNGGHSIILMSTQRNAPYRDRLEENGSVLIYEGHDVPRTSQITNPKSVDQQEYLHTGTLTENGKFHQAAQGYKEGEKGPDLVQVYEKIKKGIWSDNGFFHLIDSWVEPDSLRNVFKFKLVAVEAPPDTKVAVEESSDFQRRRRIIPTHIKLAVWKRDGGKCSICDATDELHFDHILPFSKGGTSLKEENVQLLCARHNLEKSAKIE